ncbi:MAG: M56 family metallopeptidase [Allosphingosinicella sp.]|uniref:M56 family metallopeptidase n=1 Tax=Allosphingosinicella sp. TaxID=2823234 RepID=UPI00394AD086
MTESWTALFIEILWKSALVSGAALALLALLRKRSAAERACVAHFGMAAVLLVPLIALAAPALEVPVLEAEAPAPIVASAPMGTTAAIPETGAAVVEPAAQPWWDGETSLLLAYGLPAGLMLLVTLIAILRLFALRGRANVIVQPGWLSALAHAQRRMGFKHGTALLVSEELTSPVSWGVIRPVILLSEDALESPTVAEAIIAHELAHVARLDWLNLLLARIATALFWFNPLVWMLARSGHQLREEAADDAVLRADVPNTDYAALLVGCARHEGSGMLLAANGVAPGKGSLSIRVRRILDQAAPRSPARVAWAGGCAAAALVVAAPLAAFTPVAPQAPAAPVPPAAAAAPSAPAAIPNSAAARAAPLPPTPGTPVAASAPVAPSAAVAAAVAPVAPTPRTAPVPNVAPIAIAGITQFDVAYAAAIAQANPSLNRLTPEQLVGLRVHGVTEQRLRDYASAGYSRLGYSDVINFAVHGVTPAYIRSMAAAGYRGLSPDRLVEFRIFGVTPEFAREANRSGRRLTPEQLVERRMFGDHPPPPTPARPPRRDHDD